MKPISPFLFLVPSVVVAAGCGSGIDVSAFAQSRERGTFERALTVDGPVDLTIRTGSGDVDIRTGSVDRVHVVGRITASHGHPCVIIGTRCLVGEDGDVVARISQIEAEPPIEQAGNVIQIGRTNDDPRYRNIGISYEITVPIDTQVTSRTGSGDQTIGSVNGAVRVQTGSGDIEIERAGGGLDARTGSGDIRANAVGGAIKVRTGSGDVDLAQVLKADVEAHTGSGDVTLGLPAHAAFDLTARTGSGSIESSQPVQAQGTPRRNRLEGAVRGGGYRVDIATGSGSILIR